MTFGTSSAIFQAALLNPITRAVAATAAPTGFVSLTGDTVKVALFNTTTTPDKTVTGANSGYTQGVWVTGNEVIDTLNTNWIAGGRALVTPTWALDIGTSSYCYHSANTAGAGNVTIANAYGCLVYDSTISTPLNQGICYNSFGGSAQGVTNGTFTVVWATVGATTAVFNITV